MTRHRGFTLVELVALAATGMFGLCGLLTIRGGPDDPPVDGVAAEKADGSARAQARQLKDATMIRGITQSFIIWAQNNKGSYPLPSAIDAANATVAAEGRAKDTTANILSVLIFNGNISTELCVSAAEVNKRITVKEDYQFVAPTAAAKPADALWDPSFRCDFLRQPGGNTSFAHLQPSDSRLSMWSDTFSSTQAVLGNRGPAITEVRIDEAGQPTAWLKSDKSKTFRIHGRQNSWEGNIAFNDGHVQFERRYWPEGVTYPVRPGETPATAGAAESAPAPKPDCLFFDEKDAKDGLNIYLGIWRRAGAKASEFGGAWD